MIFSYSNPAWNGYLADPFVLKWQGEYYAYGTGGADAAGRQFPVLRSSDFAHWEHLGGALEPLPGLERANHWAPEVAERGGVFYLYYSAAMGAGDETHRLCVATSTHPAGPFRSAGPSILPDVGFSIDAHPFQDPRDGKWYLFFARDYFDDPVGTGTAVVPLKDDLITPDGDPTPVIRATGDWQIYERNRFIYGRVWSAWHTVEGPFTLFHDGLYYCFYSGGNWREAQYGVGYGVADHPLGPYRDCGGAQGPTVLQGIEGKVIGPGHNSVVIGPDDRTQFIVYHAWNLELTARRMCTDPLLWTAEGPRCSGPTAGPQTLTLPLPSDSTVPSAA